MTRKPYNPANKPMRVVLVNLTTKKEIKRFDLMRDARGVYSLERILNAYIEGKVGVQIYHPKHEQEASDNG